VGGGATRRLFGHPGIRETQTRWARPQRPKELQLSSPTEKRTCPELLAPAGSVEAALAAFDAGADAVYIGLPRFNARERGKNCTLEQIAGLIGLARRTGRKVYITLNTLIKEDELPSIADILAKLAVLGPHALIVQDLGIVRMVRRHFPTLPLHASTQMGVHNSAGAALLAEQGIRRVILQRQVTFDELRLITARSPIEVEVFVHGALCCSLSGQCLFSSWLGGWSGNRGKCKQPCRRRFFADEGNGFFFSLKDLCLIDRLDELVDMGVACLKIEGRLRDVDYVRRTVSAYRKMLDASADDRGKMLGEAKNLLAGALGRKWSAGFSSKKSLEDVVQHDSLGSSGLLIGRVTRTARAGFNVRTSRPLACGDRIRVQPASGEEGPAFTVSQLSRGRRPVTSFRANQEGFVHCDKAVPADGYVFKVGVEPPDMSSRIAELPTFRGTVSLDVRIADGQIEVNMPALEHAPWSQPFLSEAAERRPVESETVAAEFARTADPAWAVGTVTADVEPGRFFPRSQLKQARRDYWAWFGANGRGILLRSRAEDAKANCLSEFEAHSRQSGKSPSHTIRTAQGTPRPPAPQLVSRSIDSDLGDADEMILPKFCPETGLEDLQVRIQRAVNSGVRRVRVTSLYGLHLLRNLRDLTITAAFPLPAANSQAVDQLVDLGATACTIWIELEKEAIQALVSKRPEHVEIFTHGRIPILVTRAKLPVEGEIRDARGIRFTVRKQGELTEIFPLLTMEIPDFEDISTFMDLSLVSSDDSETSTFNFEHQLI
jgi:U32 family peptidase